MEVLNNIFQKINKWAEDHYKILSLITIALFIYMTLVGIGIHKPWFDETQAWLIAQDLSFLDILKQMKYEGHMFLWFLAIMPWAKMHLAYPLPMQLTNLVFIWLAVIVFMKKSPLNPILNILVVFSFPIAYQYAVIARPYAMGILFLFLLAALYKDKLKRPVLYSVCLFLCANTSSMALVGAIAFALLFMIDYFKTKKEFWKTTEFYIILSIALATVAILGYQLLGADKQVDIHRSLYLASTPLVYWAYAINDGINRIIKFWTYGPMMIVSLLYLIIAIIGLYKEKESLIFFSLTTTMLTVIFIFLYKGSQWHHFFYFIYLIISLWLYKLNNGKVNSDHKLLYILFILILLGFVKVTPLQYLLDIIKPSSNAQMFVDKIDKEKKYKDGFLVLGDDASTNLVPYLRQHNLKAYNYYNGKEASFWDRKYEVPFFLTKDVLVPKYFEQYETKPIYLLAANGIRKGYEMLQSQYYDVEIQMCEKKGQQDIGQYCLLELKRKK